MSLIGENDRDGDFWEFWLFSSFCNFPNFYPSINTSIIPYTWNTNKKSTQKRHSRKQFGFFLVQKRFVFVFYKMMESHFCWFLLWANINQFLKVSNSDFCKMSNKPEKTIQQWKQSHRCIAQPPNWEMWHLFLKILVILRH